MSGVFKIHLKSFEQLVIMLFLIACFASHSLDVVCREHEQKDSLSAYKSYNM